MKNSIGNEIIPLSLTVVQITKHVEAMIVKYDLSVLPNFIKQYVLKNIKPPALQALHAAGKISSPDDREGAAQEGIPQVARGSRGRGRNVPDHPRRAGDLSLAFFHSSKPSAPRLANRLES